MTCSLNQVERRLATVAAAATLEADASHREPVTVDTEIVFAGYRFSNGGQLLAVKLDQLVANLAVEVIVLRVAVIVFVNSAAPQVQLPQQACLHEFLKRTIDGCPGGLSLALVGQTVDEFVCVEVIVPLEDVLDQRLPWLGNPLAPALQVFLESLLR